MSKSVSASSSENSPPTSFEQFNELVKGIESLYVLARRLSDAVAKQPCEYLIREASMAFVKTLMSLLGYLRFIPASRFYAKEVDRIIDLSSASVMARQIMEDATSFFYLSEPNLTPEQKKLRHAIWAFHGMKEAIEAVGFSNVLPPELPSATTQLDSLLKFLNEPGTLDGINEPERRRNIKRGRERYVLHECDILKRRGIQIESMYKLPHKVLSNFAHVSALSHKMIDDTSGDWTKCWRSFLPSTLHVARYFAETIETFVETFPETRKLIDAREQRLIADYRSWLEGKPLARG